MPGLPSSLGCDDLEQMFHSGLLDARDDGRFSFRPRDPWLSAAVDALEEAYTSRKRDVVELIFSVPSTTLERPTGEPRRRRT